MSPRVLLISYPFPPVGGAGVQRVTKFAKYLPSAGWTSSVLTVANPSVPVVDASLQADIPAETIVRRARTWEPGYALKNAVSAGEGNSGRGRWSMAGTAKGMARSMANVLLQPDPQILWMPDAVREGMRLLRETPHEAIVATAPPFSTLLIGAALSRRSGLPLVLDYRDEWGISNAFWENRRPDPFSHWIQGGMQRRAVRRARAIVATTRASAGSLEQVRDQAGSKARVECIYNGFDPEDFSPRSPGRRESGSPYRLVYAGTLWKLTSVAPLVDAVFELARTRPDLASRLELTFVGRRTGPQQEILDRLAGSPCRVVTHPYLDHDAAVELVRSADGLCILLSDLPGAERVVPAKLFESMAARRPILAIAPRGELWDLMRDYPAAYPLEPSNIRGIADRLAREIERVDSGAEPSFNGWVPTGCDRQSQTRQLAAVLDSIR